MSRHTLHEPPCSRKFRPNVSQSPKRMPDSSRPGPELNSHTSRVTSSPRHLTSSLIDLTLIDDGEEEKEKSRPGVAASRGLKRCATFEDELQVDRHRSSGPKKKIKEHAKVSDHRIVEVHDETDEDEITQTKVVINMTDDDDDVLIVDDDDIVSSGDEVQVTGARRCLKEKRKQKVRNVKDDGKPAVNQFAISGVVVKRGHCVEFQDGTFMKICIIYPDDKHKFILVGLVFTRITDKEVLMPRLRDSVKEWGSPTVRIAKIPTYLRGVRLMNEVCQRIKIAAGEVDHDKGLWRRSALEVRRARKLIMTNQPYEKDCTLQRDTCEDSLSEQVVECEGLLRCRWKETIITDEYGKVKEHKLHRPKREEVLPEHFSTESELRDAWRGSTLNLEASKTKPVMAEGFCGAGGMTSGATMAGFNVKIAFDADGKKIRTHDLNFKNCDSREVSVTNWIKWAEPQNFKVDVVHLSPPCQPWSPANTTPNIFKNEQNQAVLLACGKVVETMRPRIVTIEESDGLTNRHSEWFGALLGQLTELNFSIRWASLNCSDFGVPQTRKRVFLIASAPGEDLPMFPEPTHSPGAVSVQTMLDNVERHHEISPLSHHNPESMPRISKTAYDYNRLANCITCKGGDNNYHPSGLRPFTIREFLALQTFPHGFHFPDNVTQTEMRIQLGNAVPPLMGAALMRSILKSLLAADRRRIQSSGGGEEGNPIEL